LPSELAGLTVEQVAQFANHGFGLESTSEFSVQSIDETVDGDKELPEFHDLPLFPQDLSSAKQLAIDPPRPLDSRADENESDGLFHEPAQPAER